MITYKGHKVVVLGERSIEGEPVIMWIAQLASGKIIMEPMWQFEIHVVSVLDEIRRKAA